MTKESMIEQIKNVSASELVSYLDFGIDQFLADGVMRDIPVIGSIISIFKVGKTIKDYHFTKKVMAFISEYQKIDKNEKYDKFISKIHENSKFSQSVVETIVVSIDRMDKAIKAKIYARLLVAYINDNYSYNEFIYVSSLIESLFLIDFTTIVQIVKQKSKAKIDDIALSFGNKDITRSCIERIKSVGLISLTNNTYEALNDYYASTIVVNDLGHKFYIYCLKNLNITVDDETVAYSSI